MRKNKKENKNKQREWRNEDFRSVEDVDMLPVPKRYSQSNKQPSDELLRMIEEVNLVPYNVELKPINLFTIHPAEVSSNTFPELKEFPLLIEYLKSLNLDWKNTAEKFNEFLKMRDFIRCIVEISKDYNDFLEAIDVMNSDSMKRVKNFMMQGGYIPPPLIKFYISSTPQNYKTWLMPYLSSFSELMSTYSQGQPSSELPNKDYKGKRFFETAIEYFQLTTDDSHGIEYEWVGLAEVIRKHDLRRFKKCWVCQRVFWAYRLDAKYCSKKCSNLYHQKIYQSDEKKRANHNEKRRDTYHLKKDERESERIISEEKRKSRREWLNQDFNKKEK